MTMQQQVPDDTSLIQPSPRERLFTLLEQMKMDNLTAKQKRKADAHQEVYQQALENLCWDFLGINEQQVAQLPDDEFRELERVVTQKALRIAIAHRIFFGTNPIGWFTWLAIAFVRGADYSSNFKFQKMSNAWTLDFNRRKLQKFYGKGYSLRQKQSLNKNCETMKIS